MPGGPKWPAFAYQEKLEKLRSAITSGKSGVGDIIIFATHSKKKENVEVGACARVCGAYVAAVALMEELKVTREVFTSRLIRRKGGKV